MSFSRVESVDPSLTTMTSKSGYSKSEEGPDAFEDVRLLVVGGRDDRNRLCQGQGEDLFHPDIARHPLIAEEAEERKDHEQKVKRC